MSPVRGDTHLALVINNICYMRLADRTRKAGGGLLDALVAELELPELVSTVVSLFNPSKPRFPWMRLLLGAYFSVPAIVGLLRLPSAKQVLKPYIVSWAILFLVVGALLLGSGIWIAVDRRNSN